MSDVLAQWMNHLFVWIGFGAIVGLLSKAILPGKDPGGTFATVFIGIFGSFTFYLPELFPTRLRGTGSGFTYNIGRLVAAFGPFLVGSIAASGANALDSAIRVLFWVGVVPLVGVLMLPLVIETKEKVLED